MWGLANNMNDTLLAAFKRILSITDLQSSLVQFAFYGAYFCFAIPAAIFIRKFSYKSGILLGLGIYAAGTFLFYPAGLAKSYIFFLISIYIMAGGCAILETTANPYVLALGDPSSATRRLNIAQTFNPIGALGGILLSRHFILSSLHQADAAERASMNEAVLKNIQSEEFNAVSETYIIIGFILAILFIIILFLKMPVIVDEKENSKGEHYLTTFKHLISNRSYISGVFTQFFYVGAQTCVWSFTIRYVMVMNNTLESDASLVFLWSIIAFSLFRFLFTWLMKYIRPLVLMAWCSVIAIAATGVVILGIGDFSIVALIVISACMSLMFPTIYALSLEQVSPEDRKIGASGLIMAILGGALITPIQGLISDSYGITNSFIVTLICFVIILLYCFNIKYNNTKEFYKKELA